MPSRTDQAQEVSRIGLLALVVLCAFACLASIMTASAGAVTDSEEFARFGSEGAGAGQLSIPRRMASDPTTGHLYVADTVNARISEFTAWGDFVKAWGWGVADGVSKLETCTTTCLKGLTGSGKGQFALGDPLTVAVDGSSNIYALDTGNLRVQKFTASGQFVLMFGGGVNKTTGGDICTEASGDECQVGNAGAGPGEFAAGVGLAISQISTVLVGGQGRIQEFEPNGSFKREFSAPGIVDAIAPDPTGSDIYATYRGQDNVHRFDSSGTEVLPPIEVSRPSSIVTDPATGDLYAIRFGPEEEPSQRVVEFNPSGAEVSSCCVPAVIPGGNGGRFTLTGLGTNGAGDLYVANRSIGQGNYITALGPPPLKYGDPPKVPPTISGQFLSSAEATSAVVKAKINPNLWKDTRYFLEYGLADCAASSCTQQPASPGTELGAGAVNKAVTSSAIILTGLTPNTTYHYRFVAESGGGGPVFGPDRTFTTFPATHPPDSCPANQAFRTGASANLPDCRAYEMVSPLDKNNGDIHSLLDVMGWETHLNQAASDGDSFTYSSYRAFGGAGGGPYISQYLARRGNGGWGTEALGAPLNGNFYGALLLENEFKAFSPDLCHSWLVPAGESTLAAGEIAGFPNLYRRDNCPKGYEALTTTTPPNLVPGKYYPEPQGYSADGSKAIFRTFDNLTPDSPAQPQACIETENCHTRLYEASGGELRYVCLFPEGTSAKTEAELPNCSAGSSERAVIPNEPSINRVASVTHAMSEDGSRIYWSASGDLLDRGKIYVRIDGTTTLPVSEAEGAGKTTKPARFLGASPDGSKALYVVADPDQENPTPKDKSLYLYDLGAEGTTTLVAPGVRAVFATSEDLSSIYFVSKAVLAGTSGATAGEENLYLHEAGGDTFIAKLSGTDVGGVANAGKSNGSPIPVFHLASATPDGGRLAFVSTEPLTGFDNTDLASGEADSEVFTYDAATGQLACASCSPAGVRPAGRYVSATPGLGEFLWTAATLPTPQTELNAPRALSADGTKLFFTSYVDLLPADTNGVADVYEWEAVGSGSCADESDLDYYPVNGGCLFLISSGESPSDSVLVDTAASGRDAFFTTNSSLLVQDPGLIDVYDARVGGGFPPPTGPPAPCEGEACQSPLSAPNDPTPASASFKGAGNATQAKKHKRKAHQKKRKQAKRKAHRAAKHDRRNPR